MPEVGHVLRVLPPPAEVGRRHDAAGGAAAAHRKAGRWKRAACRAHPGVGRSGEQPGVAAAPPASAPPAISTPAPTPAPAPTWPQRYLRSLPPGRAARDRRRHSLGLAQRPGGRALRRGAQQGPLVRRQGRRPRARGAGADGRVVYAGSGLRGYGNLVIVKHNATYLTAYAHNQTLLVKEDQLVRRGQKIAEMGSSDSDRVQLHFEVRRLGKPVDPVKVLPPR
ncbi:MAG: peptidoglycan DD-metalloendopeptidase family protein [Rubrivivax sp.]